MKSTPYMFLVCLVFCLSGQSLPAQTVTPPSSEVDVTGAAMTLAEIVRETKDPDAKWRAIWALRDLRYKNAAPLLLECLKDHHHYVRANAARALGDIRIQAASAPLIDLLKQERDGGVIEQTSLALTRACPKQGDFRLMSSVDYDGDNASCLSLPQRSNVCRI